MYNKGICNLSEYTEKISLYINGLPNDMCTTIRQSIGSMTMQVAKMVVQAVGVPRMGFSGSQILSPTECYEKLFSHAFGEISEKVYRNPHSNIEDCLRNISEMNFREFDCKFLYIRCPALLKMLDIENDLNDGVFVFAYIDYQAGISFDILGTASIINDQILISDVSQSKKTKIRHGFFERMQKVKVMNVLDSDVIINECYQEAAKHEIYYKDLDADIIAMRNNRDIDAARHPSFPDDIQICLVKGGQIIEAPWARCTRIDKFSGFMYAKLLNEPHNNFGFHANSEIPFKVIEANDGTLTCINLEHYNR